MARVLKRSLLAVSGLALLLAGCSAAPIVDELPANMGLPAGTPARPQQIEVEKELAAARDRQEARERPAKKASPAAKKKRATAKNGEAADPKDGANRNP